MAKLRDPESGCPWDLEQSMGSLVKHTLEEAYEVADAILREDPAHICEELGDLLFQVVFYAQIAKEEEQFDLDDVAHSICEKLVRRHPHVFGERAGKMTPDEVAEQWSLIKAQEKAAKKSSGVEDTSVFADLAGGKPALMRANDLQKRCAKVGFDWPNHEPVFEKVQEELTELEQEMVTDSPDHNKQTEELGDLLFALVNLARHLDIDPDEALQLANSKFEKRFRQMETIVSNQDQKIEDLNLAQLEALWQRVKSL
jgi:ATP diphosphatase